MISDTGRVAYDTDFYSWSLEQARLVRQGDWAALDRDNVAEEIESLARGEFNKLEAAIRKLLVEILKWDHVPASRGRSSILSIDLQRIEIEELLSDNPGVRSRIPEAIARAYRRARLGAAKETELDEVVFPENCAYGFQEIVMREFVL
ncbi:MAG TPA: DUF29 domain-containing protein [Xanthobacteraceae bacterium]|nr:DUF29 domain-containing protein [Xanthobacteraceae bacterium]